MMKCSTCTKETNAADGLCNGCRLIAATRRRQQYVWTPDLDAALRRAYQVRGKVELTRAKREIARRTGFPAYILQNRASVLGLRLYRSEEWPPADLFRLRNLAGTMPGYKIARLLKRSESGVKQRLWRMGLEARVVEGFSRNELTKLMGVRHGVIERWVGRGWLTLDANDRVPQRSVENFVWTHMDEYRFGSCEEWWLKSMLNPETSTGVLGKKKVVAA